MVDTEEFHPTDMGELATEAQRSYRTAQEMAYHVLRDSILAGTYVPGQRLPQEQIANALGVSRIPVRSALHQLEAEGFVTIVAHRGATVRSLTADEIRESYDLRVLLETFALRAVFRHITEAHIEGLWRLARAIHSESHDAAGRRDSGQAFYDYLYQIGGLTITCNLISKLRADVSRYWHLRKVIEHQGHAHGAIVRALADGDLGAAEAWIRDHLGTVSAELQQLVRADENID